MGTFTWSDQQMAIFEHGEGNKGSLNVNALAGCTKTTTAVEYARRLKRRRVFMGAFNKSIADELSQRVQGTPHCTASTFHSIGYKLWKEMRCLAELDSRKVPTLVRELYPYDKKVREVIVDAIGFAKLDGMGLTGMPEYTDLKAWEDMFDEHDMWDDIPSGISDERVLGDCVRIFKKSLDMCEANESVIDFNDMLYAPLYFGMWKPHRYDTVIMDEAQDTNVTRLRLAQSILVPGGSFVAVGDKHQCQPAGTSVAVILEKGTQHYQECIKYTPIEKVKVGDNVISYDQSGCAFIKGRKVEAVAKRKFTGELRVIHLDSGHATKYTSNHHCLVNFSKLRDKWCVYLMRKSGKFRIGKCKMDYGKTMPCGVRSRMNAEGAEQGWILTVCDTAEGAYALENVISANYGIPQIMFTIKNNSKCGQIALDFIWAEINVNTHVGVNCLEAFGRDVECPLFSCRDWKESMKRPIITYASNIMPGCTMLPYKDSDNHVRQTDWALVETVKREQYSGYVYSLSVAGEHLYCADGIMTHNCIFQFAGAKADAMEYIKEATGADELPLTVTYRCPRVVVAMANAHVPDFTAAPGNKEGKIINTDHNGLWRMASSLTPADAILCRNTRPLVGIAKRLRADYGIPCVVEGNTGKAVISLLLKWGETMTWGAYTTRLNDYKTEQIAKLMLCNPPKEEKAAYIADKVATIYDIADDPTPDTPLKDIVARAERLFGRGLENADVVRLCSIHRSKGREWERVFLIGKNRYMPSYYAKTEEDKQAEANVEYVAITRTKDALVLVSVPVPSPGMQEEMDWWEL